MSENKNKKQNVLGGAIVLVVATALVKVIGAIYKIPLTGIIGTLGRGYFASAYNIYTPIYAISMAGLPVAVSAIVSKKVALGKYRDVRQVLKVTFPLFLGLGLVGTGVLFAAAKPYVESVGASPALYSVLAIAPSILFCCVMSTYRGYYEGLNNMYPTAISQVIESLGKLIFGLGLSFAIKKYGFAQIEATGKFMGKVIETEQDKAIVYAFAAAGAILGVTLGTVFACAYTILRHKIKKDGITKENLVNSPLASGKRDTVKEIVAIAVPTAISSLVLNITNFIDAWMIQNRLESVVSKHYDSIMDIYGSSIKGAGIAKEAIHTFIYGAYDTTMDFKNLVPTIMMTLGVSAIPIISGAMAKKDHVLVKDTVNTVFRTTMLIALPAGVGFFVLSGPILELLYSGSEAASGIPIATPVLALYGLMMPILTLSAPLTNILQAVGRADIPAKMLALGCGIKIGLNYVLIGIPSINVQGAVFGTAAFYLFCIFGNYWVLKKETGMKLDLVTVIIKPLIASALCGAGAFGAYKLIASVLGLGNALGCIGAIGVAVVVYAVAVLLLKTLVKNDILMLPKGEKIAEILEKYKLIV